MPSEGIKHTFYRALLTLRLNVRPQFFLINSVEFCQRLCSCSLLFGGVGVLPALGVLSYFQTFQRAFLRLDSNNASDLHHPVPLFCLWFLPSTNLVSDPSACCEAELIREIRWRPDAWGSRLRVFSRTSMGQGHHVSPPVPKHSAIPKKASSHSCRGEGGPIWNSHDVTCANNGRCPQETVTGPIRLISFQVVLGGSWNLSMTQDVQ